ncbi:putative ribonuclease VapC, partial [Candidatus Jidaibacter acanthamoeba]
GEVYISAITASELLIGVHRADSIARKNRRAAFVEYILSNISSLPFTLEIARIHAEIYAGLQSKGEIIGAHDIIIGATAMAYSYPIITMNTREFDRIAGLKVLIPQEKNSISGL